MCGETPRRNEHFNAFDSFFAAMLQSMWFAEVAQLVEQPIRNRQVPGSSPGLGSNIPFPWRRLRISVGASIGGVE